MVCSLKENWKWIYFHKKSNYYQLCFSMLPMYLIDNSVFSALNWNKIRNELTIQIWYYLIKKSNHHHHHHHVVPLARISLTLSRHLSLSFIASGRSSGLHPVSSHSCCMNVRAGRPAFARPYAGVHRSTSLMSSSLLLQQCPAWFVRLTWIVFVMGSRWSYSWCLVGCCRQDLFNIACKINNKVNGIFSVIPFYLLFIFHDVNSFSSFHLCPCQYSTRPLPSRLGGGLQNTLTALLQRGKTSPTSVLDMTLNSLMMRFQQCWSFGECRVPLIAISPRSPLTQSGSTW